jgi:hypothetical protein
MTTVPLTSLMVNWSAAKPAEIEDVGRGVEVDVGIGSPIPGNTRRRHGTSP